LRLLFAVPCRSATVGPDGADIEGAGINQVWVESVPGDVSFTVLLGLATVPQDPEGKLELHLLGPGMTVLEQLEAELAADPPAGGASDLPPGFEATGLVPIVLRFTAQDAGTHSIEVYLDGRHRDSLFFVVNVGTPD